VSPELESIFLVASGIVAGLTSFPLVYLAVHSHRKLGELERSQRTLHRVVISQERRPAPQPRPHTRHRVSRSRYPSRRSSSAWR